MFPSFARVFSCRFCFKKFPTLFKMAHKPSLVETSPEITEKYTKILQSNGIFDKISQVTEKDPNLREEGMGSDRRYVTIKFEDPNLQQLNLFTKILVATNPSHVEILRAMKSFEKESIFLMKYVPAAMEMFKAKGLNESLVTDLYPKCYYADDSTVVMENIVVDKGYMILGKTERHDFEIAALSLKALAHHHAISYAMIQEAGGPDKFFHQYPVFNYEGFLKPGWVSMMEPWMQSSVNINITILEKMGSDIEGVADAILSLKQIQKRSDVLMELCGTCLEPEEYELLLLNHGDYWYTNVMFVKDPKTNKITHLKTLDFQVIRYNSPAIDLIFYLFTSVKTEIRQNHLRELIQIYLTDLKKLADDLGHPIDLDYDTLLIQYRKKVVFGLIFSFIVQYGPGITIFKNMDITKVKVSEWGPTFERLGEEWIAENPEEAKSVAKEVVSVVKEFVDLELQ